MSKKTYRRLLLTASMLLVTGFLTYSSPVQHAQNPCNECHDNCDAQYEICLMSGSHCEQSRDLCHEACVIVCS